MFYLLDYKINDAAVVADSADFSIELLNWSGFESAIQQGLTIQGVSIGVNKAGNRSVHLNRCNLPVKSGRDTMEYYAQLGYPVFVMDKLVSSASGYLVLGSLLKFPQIDYSQFISNNSMPFLDTEGKVLSNEAALYSEGKIVAKNIPDFGICNKSFYLISGKEHAMKVSTLVSQGNKSLMITPSKGTNWTTVFDKNYNDSFMSVIQYVWKAGVVDFM